MCLHIYVDIHIFIYANKCTLTIYVRKRMDVYVYDLFIYLSIYLPIYLSIYRDAHNIDR